MVILLIVAELVHHLLQVIHSRDLDITNVVLCLEAFFLDLDLLSFACVLDGLSGGLVSLRMIVALQTNEGLVALHLVDANAQRHFVHLLLDRLRLGLLDGSIQHKI